MTTLLLCNVGTQDVQIRDGADFPAELRKPDGKLTPRPAGQYILDRWPQYQDAVVLPIIEKALKHIDSAPEALSVKLFASDQPEGTPAHFRNNDTSVFGEIIKKILKQRYRLDRKHQVKVALTRKSPADFDLMHDFYVQELRPSPTHDENYTEVYLLLAGGTQAMTTMLLFAASERFGALARPLYVSPDRPAMELDINRQLIYRSLQKTLGEILRAYAYPTALALLHNQAEVVPAERLAVLTALLNYAGERRNFRFPEARHALRPALRESRELRPALEQLGDDLVDDNEINFLRETVFLAEVAAEAEDWPDFLARLYRFSEGSLQLLAERFGVTWSDPKNRKSYKESWWKEQRAILHELKLAAAEAPADPASENQARRADRHNLRTIVGKFGEGDPDVLRLLVYLDTIGKPVAVRNNIVHGFTPITRADIENKGASIAELLAAMRAAHAAQFGRPVAADNPYRVVNQLCTRILSGEK